MQEHKNGNKGKDKNKVNMLVKNLLKKNHFRFKFRIKIKILNKFYKKFNAKLHKKFNAKLNKKYIYKYISYRCAFLFYKQVHSNFFMTLADKKKKVIQCITSGNSLVGNSSRQKRSPYSMEKLCTHLMKFLKLYKLKNLHIIVHTKPNSAFVALMQQLTLKHIKIKHIYERVKMPHNGIRSKNPRRK